MRIFNTADLHFGHKSILKYRTQFSSIEEHDNLILDKFSKLNKNDIVIVHGDFIFKSPQYDYYIEKLSRMSCRIKVILGNHDSVQLYKETRIPKMEICLPLYTYKDFWLSHCPIHPNEMRSRIGNIHGHTHYYSMKEKEYYCVSLDINEFNFIEFDKIKEHFSK